MLTIADSIKAQHRLQNYLQPTPLEFALQLGEHVYLKLENVNPTHSFKIRGALNAMLSLDESIREKGVIVASSGNHAQGVAYATKLTNTHAQIFMPKHTPQKKVDGVRLYGVEAVLFGENYDEAEAEALQRAQSTGKHFISPYNDREVMAGAGTIGLEIVEQLPDVERVIVPVSGGGLIGGIGTVLKSINSNIDVVGVNAVSAPAMYNVFHRTQKPQIWETLAEALSGDIEAGSMTIDICQRVVDSIQLVTEEDIASAMRWMLTKQGWLIEGGGAVGVALLLASKLGADSCPTVIVISGSNVDATTIGRMMSQTN